MTTKTTLLAATFSLCLVSGTGTDEPAAVHDSVDSPSSDDQDEQIERNGVHLSGVELSGLSWLDGSNGAFMLLGGEIDGQTFDEAQVGGSLLAAAMPVAGQVVVLSGPELLGARLDLLGTAVTASGDVFETIVEAAITGIERIDGDTYAYHLLVHDPDSGSWLDPCPDNDGKGLILLNGAWEPGTGDWIDSERITLACRDDVLAKCVEWGYEPWYSTELAELHQACTRMARADYCGDGTPMTLEATGIDVFDVHGIQKSATAWPVEAEWGPDGATCVSGEVLRANLLGIGGPDCLAELVTDDCGGLASGSLANRYRG
jgi:hypothetical protein